MRPLAGLAALTLLTPCLLAGGLPSLAEAEDGSQGMLTRGEALLGSYRCIACHAAGRDVKARVAPTLAPRLDRVGARLSATWMRRFLEDPHAVDPGTTMPDLLGILPEEERELAIAELVHFLAAQGGPFEIGGHTASAEDMEEGRQLFHRVGCAACHGGQESPADLELPFWEFEQDERASHPAAPEAAVLIQGLEEKTSVDALAEFLRDPLATRPDGRMPSLSLDEEQAHALALYLLRQQVLGHEDPYSEAPGLSYSYYEASFKDDVADWDSLEPARSGSVVDLSELPEHRGDNFGFVFGGLLRVDEADEYTFSTTSDDGSRLHVDDELVVANDGHHPMREVSGSVQLEAGWHSFEVSMFQGGGGSGLDVSWSRPGVEASPIPGERFSHLSLSWSTPGASALEPIPELVEAGRARFQQLGCARCHTTSEEELAPASRTDPSLARLDPHAAGGCLDDASRPGTARFAFADGEREALRAALERPFALSRPLSPEASLTRSLERMRCLSCHQRGDQGGPTEATDAYFQTVGEVDLGDQGRIPPELHETGSKLRPAWLERVLLEKGRWRPYMATRMPQFGASNVGHLPALFAQVDGQPEDRVEPVFSPEAVHAGQRLTGTNGLGCIQCHQFAGFDSLGVPAVDLVHVTERLQPRWFRSLLLDPAAIDMNTRMPNFWVEGESPVADVYSGDPGRQVDALWSYLSLGTAMPLPAGLVVPDDEFELFVGDSPRMVGVFMKDTSPRTVAVGFPERTHYAFDVQNSRLSTTWRGRFFNARGTWEGRAGQLQRPPEESEVLDLPAGMPLARLDSADAPWPTGVGRDAGHQARGRRMDEAGRPAFRYSLGPVEITEQPQPALRAGGATLVRRFQLSSDSKVDDLWLRAAVGKRIEAASDGGWRVDDRYTIHIHGVPASRVRATTDGQELVCPLPLDGELVFELEVAW